MPQILKPAVDKEFPNIIAGKMTFNPLKQAH